VTIFSTFGFFINQPRPRPLINRLEKFRAWLRIRNSVIFEFRFRGVNDTRAKVKYSKKNMSWVDITVLNMDHGGVCFYALLERIY
jgi:hypothetical protein